MADEVTTDPGVQAEFLLNGGSAVEPIPQSDEAPTARPSSLPLPKPKRTRRTKAQIDAEKANVAALRRDNYDDDTVVSPRHIALATVASPYSSPAEDASLHPSYPPTVESLKPTTHRVFTPVQIIAMAGILSSASVALAGVFSKPAFLSAAGVVMLAGNVYSLAFGGEK
jgi:hypothetical protein